MSTDNSTNSFLGGFLEEDEDEYVVKQSPKSNALDGESVDQSANSQSSEVAISPKSGTVVITKSEFADTDILIESNIRALREKYPQGGVKSSRVITSRILREAPADYFDRFTKDVEDGTSFVQNLLVDRGGSEIIAKSQANPTDEAVQEQAFRKIQSLILEYLGRRAWSGADRAIISQLITNEIIGFSSIDPLWRDKSINEIAVNGPFSITIEVAGKWKYVKSCKFHTQEHLERLLERLYQSVNKSPSRMTPRLKGRLHDNSRLWTMHKSIMPKGPSLNVRRHPERFWAPIDLIERGSCSPEVMTTIGNLIYKGCSFLIVGGTSTGKTSMLNALTGFYRNDARIITVEDSLEMKPNPNKMVAPGLETIPSRPDENDRGVTIRDLVQGTLQMAPDVIIVGESTGGEAYDLCQALNTGHAGASTIHANDIRGAMPRMLSLVGQGEVIRAEAALPLIGAAFDFMIYLEHSSIDGSRKIAEVAEIPTYPEFDKANKPFLNPRTIWKLNREVGTWEKFNEISDELIEMRGLKLEPDLTWEELKELSKV